MNVSRGMVQFVALALVVWAGVARAAGPEVVIVVGPEAPALERQAAEEVADHLKLLFDARTAIATSRPAQKAAILVGSPATNPAIKSAAAEGWPKLSEQGHLLKSIESADGPSLIVGGGSPVATYWAASELGHQFGIRSLVFGNLPPEKKPEFSLAGMEMVKEPSLAVRGWTLMDATPVGGAAWGLEDQKRAIRQLARMKFNRIVLDVQPWQPFVAWTYDGVSKTSDTLWPKGAIKVDGDTAGRGAFRGAALFDNPDLAGKKPGDDRIKAGIALLTGIIDEAHRYGMTVALSLHPFEFPKEFESKVPESTESAMEDELAVVPGSDAPLTDPRVQKIAVSQVRAYVDTYPKLDLLVLNTTFDWSGDAQQAWARLQASGTVSQKATAEVLLEEATKRKGLLGGEVGATAVEAQIAAIPGLRALVENPDLAKRKGTPIPVELGGVDPALARLGLRITTTGASVLFLSEGDGKELKAEPANRKLTATLDWSDYLTGVQPRFHFKSTAAAIQRLTREKWGGFIVNATPMGGLDPTAYYVSQAAFEPKLAPQDAVRELLDHIAGAGVAERVLKGFMMVEDVADGVDLKTIDAAGPDAEVFERHAVAEKAPEWWAKLRDANLEAMNEMYRANTRAREGGREFTLYYARKFEFAFETMNALESMRQASVAGDGGEGEKQVELLEKAVESMYGGLNAQAAVPRDPSDRGVIALMNAYGYRVLQKQLQDAEGK